MKIGLIVGGDDAMEGEGKEIEDILFWMDPKKANSFLTNGEYVSKDVTIAGKMKELYPKIELDLIKFTDINKVEKGKKRLAQNDVNFMLGEDLVEAFWSKKISYDTAYQVFNAKSSRMFPTSSEVNWILDKGVYLNDLAKAGVPVAPTFVVYHGKTKGFPTKKDNRSAKSIIARAKKMGWENLISKPILGASGKGFKKWGPIDRVSESKLNKYMNAKQTLKFPGIIFQPEIEGFSEHWEIRTYWLNGVFKYALGTKHDFEINDDEVSDEIDPAILKQCKKIAKKAMKVVPKNVIKGKVVKPTLLRIDCGCCLDNGKKKLADRYFINEVEYQNTTLWADFTDYDVIKEYAKVLVKKAEELIKLGWRAGGKRSTGRRSKVKRSSRGKRRFSRRRRKGSKNRRRRRFSRGTMLPEAGPELGQLPTLDLGAPEGVEYCGPGPMMFGAAPYPRPQGNLAIDDGYSAGRYSEDSIPTPGGFAWEGSPLDRALNAGFGVEKVKSLKCPYCKKDIKGASNIATMSKMSNILTGGFRTVYGCPHCKKVWGVGFSNQF